VALAVFDEVAVIDPAVLVCLPHQPGFRASDFLCLPSRNSATTFGNANMRRDLGVLGGTRHFPPGQSWAGHQEPILDGRCEDGPQKRHPSLPIGGRTRPL
jgi:hypothetical protein